MFKKFFAWLFSGDVGPDTVIVEYAPDRFMGILGDGIDPEHVVEFEEAVGYDLAAATPLDLKESKPSDWRHFFHQFQSSSGSCVEFTIAKIAQILYFLRYARKVKFSPGWIYRRRKNFPRPGMSIGDVVELASGGMITEELYPSEGLSDSKMNALPDVEYGDDVAEAFAIPPNWVNLPNDFDIIAKSLIKTEKGIMLWLRYGKNEFFNKGIPISNGSKQEYHHSVTAIQPVLYKGTEYLLIEDSADKEEDTEFEGRKLISRAWLAKHFSLARYPLGFKFEPQGPEKPSYDGSVVSLQDCLKFEGVFPSNVNSTGVFGSITIKAVQDFQKKYSIVFTGTPATTGYGSVGPKTKAKLLELYP